MAVRTDAFFTKLVLDVLKPHKPSIIELGTMLSRIKGVERVSILIQEVDAETETVKATIEGNDVHYERLVDAITKNGGVVHSVDEVVIGKVHQQP